MEDIVAIRVADSRGKKHFFLTWGRAFDRVDSKPLLQAVRSALPKYGLSAVRNLTVCSTLQGAADQPYFCQALFALSRQRVLPARARRARIVSGKDSYYPGKRSAYL